MHCLQISAEICAVCDLWNNLVYLKHWEIWRVACNWAVYSVEFLFLTREYHSINRAFCFSDSFWYSVIYVVRGCQTWWASGRRWPLWSQPRRCEAAVAPCLQVQPVATQSRYSQELTHTLLAWLAARTNKERKLSICSVTYVLSECFDPSKILGQVVKIKGLLDHQRCS